MIQANNVTLRVGKKALFEDVNIKFTEGNCYGLIGANGAGKSTFLKILSGQLEPTNGDVVITPGQRLSFLQQDHFKYDAFTVLDTVIMGNQRLYDIMKEKDAIYMKEDFSDEDGIRASELEGEFAEMDGWNAESDAATLLNGLGISTDYHYSMFAGVCYRHVCVGNNTARGHVYGGLRRAGSHRRPQSQAGFRRLYRHQRHSLRRHVYRRRGAI